MGEPGTAVDRFIPLLERLRLLKQGDLFFLLWIFRMGVPMLLQGRKTQHLLSGGNAQFAVNILVVVF